MRAHGWLGNRNNIQRSALPDISEFEQWFDENCKSLTTNMNAVKLRRLVQMRLGGEGWSSINEALAHSSAKEWYYKLPEYLKGNKHDTHTKRQRRMLAAHGRIG